MEQLKIGVPEGLLMMVAVMVTLLILAARIAIILVIMGLFWLYFSLGG